jgi:hypothetical protein
MPFRLFFSPFTCSCLELLIFETRTRFLLAKSYTPPEQEAWNEGPFTRLLHSVNDVPLSTLSRNKREVRFYKEARLPKDSCPFILINQLSSFDFFNISSS